jgi:hypothetical protein
MAAGMLCLPFSASLVDGPDALELAVYDDLNCRTIRFEAFMKLSRTLTVCNAIDRSRTVACCGGRRHRVLYHSRQDPASWVSSSDVL